ncbi:unnamed protein product (macronuclear) [Paramecium tetraurelia]|uniref:Transmembrane protein n=1 Tax=Paramecium tetraurelia TaxID=5888 RepID=A0D5J4_PARTE|nr:uncharacterized protein GSPATT00013741001 [Paramecium tetraurelia]CAK78311.1 unnamed protein product [Paramecium tetraurelia]|eukprot:XP_001445708.1 hypothetical protein (macronuclear) [Paramecium tetraurelia strain d4-2]
MLLLLSIPLVWTQQFIDITFKEICNCDELVTQQDCQRDLYCFWSKNKCENIRCEDLNPYLCQTSRKCFNNFTSSQDPKCSKLFTSSDSEDFCSHLLSNGTRNCYDQNVWCTNQTNSDYCTLQSTTHCESLLTQQQCLYNFGYCAWNNGVCTVAQCKDLDNDQCAFYPFYCILNNNACVNAECQYLPEYFCNYIINSTLENGYQIQVCQYDYNISQCQAITTQELTKDNCFKNTLHTYYWNHNQCQKCYENILFMVCLIMYLLF